MVREKVLNENIEKCSACSACVEICACNAIKMEMDRKGFWYPIIDDTLCVQCGKCIEVCSANAKSNLRQRAFKQKVFSYKINELNTYLQSQSGGAFSAMSQIVLQDGGVVWGAAFDADKKVVYHKVTQEEELLLLKGSKYVQAKIEIGMYKDIEQDLKAGKKVLIGATPCHIDGLLQYLKVEGADIGNLIVCDLVCHGVPSPKIYEDFLEYCERHKGNRIQDFKFKDKNEDGKSSIIFEDESKEVSDFYMNLFYKNLNLREKCYQCPYANMDRIGDITVGDFWGLDKIAPEYWDERGISLVIVNTTRGEKLFERVKEEAEVMEWSLSECIQPNLLAPTKRPDCVDVFWHEWENYGIEFVYKKYVQNYVGDQFNFEAIENWVSYTELGQNIAAYFLKCGMKSVVVCRIGENDFADWDKNIKLFITQLKYAGVYVPYVLDMHIKLNEEGTLDFPCPVKSIADLTEYDRSVVDAFVIMDEKYMVDMMEQLTMKGISAEKIVPFSFITAMEV